MDTSATTCRLQARNNKPQQMDDNKRETVTLGREHMCGYGVLPGSVLLLLSDLIVPLQVFNLGHENLCVAQ